MNESVHQDIFQISTSVYLIINNIFCLKNFAFCIYLRAIDFDAFFRGGGGVREFKCSTYLQVLDTLGLISTTFLFPVFAPPPLKRGFEGRSRCSYS